LDENADSIHNAYEITLENNCLFLFGSTLLKINDIPRFF